MTTDMLAKVQADLDRTKRTRDMLAVLGHKLGDGGGVSWWVLDGKLYCVRSATQIDVSDYHAECRSMRANHGGLPWEMGNH